MIQNLLDSIKISKSTNYPDRPTIVFLHDSLGCIELWRDFPSKLGELTQCNVFVYDRLGYGQSGPVTDQKRGNDYMEIEADILSQLLDQHHIENAILFGHSDGGTIALLAAAKYPSKIRAVITEGAHIFVEEVTLNGIREAVKLYQTTNLKQRLQKYHGEKTEDVFMAWTETWLSDAYRSWNIEHFLPEVICPSLIIQGEEDEYGTVGQVDGIVNKTSGAAQKYMLPTIKHSPHKEAPELVLKIATAFILEVV